MNGHRTLLNIAVRVLVLSVAMVAFAVSPAIAEPGPDINPEFPVRERTNLSPPIVESPINECARAVHVRGAVPHALIEVFANGNELIGKDTTWVGEGDITLLRTLNIGDVIAAQQTVSGVTSLRTIQPVTVTAFVPGALGKPDVAKELWGCGIVVPAGNLRPSTTVKVYQDGAFIGQGQATGSWLPVVTQPLIAGHGVRAQQIICDEDPTRRIEGPLSDPAVTVGSAPNPPSAPMVDKASVVPGKDTILLNALFVGAEGIVRDNGNIVSSSMFATAPTNWWPISPSATGTSKIDAAQSLCSQGPFSPAVEATTTIADPIMSDPLCDGQQFALIRNTMLGANVAVFADGGIIGYGGGAGGDLLLGLGRKLRANPVDNVSARQYYGTQTISNPSNVVAVKFNGSPSYDPGKWNHPSIVRCNNCYNYGCNIRTDTFAQPGQAHGVSHSTDCPTVGNAAKADGLDDAIEGRRCTGCTHLAALVIDPDYPDYHWYRLDDNGMWSHKPGGTPATNVDASNNIITNPETADRRSAGPDYALNYRIFCGYYCIDKNNVEIAGSRACK